MWKPVLYFRGAVLGMDEHLARWITPCATKFHGEYQEYDVITKN
jgi:hypothetical protein